MDKNIEIFCSLFSKETGITFPTSRYSFVANHLAILQNKYNCRDLPTLIEKSKKDIHLKIDIVNALTTNETWFFRHPEHFEILKNTVIPKLIKEKKKINIWSAGCSVGAELYSILITLKESIPQSANVELNILGSDLSFEAVQFAKKGIYDKNYLRTTDRAIINKYFDKLDNNQFRIKLDLQKEVKFERLNLLGVIPPRTFDIIFCRNTMIYFNEASKKILYKKFYKSLEQGGYLFSSANEQSFVDEENYGFKKIYTANEYIYQKTNQMSYTNELHFKSPSDLLKATNCLRKNAFFFQFGKPTISEKGNELRSLLVKSSDADNIITTLSLCGVEPIKILISK